VNNNISPKNETGDRDLNPAYNQPEILPITAQLAIG